MILIIEAQFDQYKFFINILALFVKLLAEYSDRCVIYIKLEI
jgi:hypothetical protein